MRLVDLDGRGQGLVVQRHDRLEQPAGACRTLGVANLRLHRAQCTPLPVCTSGIVENLTQRGEFGDITGLGSSAVSLNKADCFRTVSSGFVSAA